LPRRALYDWLRALSVVNILGSFFPAWLISIATGLVLALVVWRGLVGTGIATYLTPPENADLRLASSRSSSAPLPG